MLKFSCNYALFKIKVVDKTTPLLFEGLTSSDGCDALCKALVDDCNQESELTLVHPKVSNKKYERRHVLPACYGFASLTVGRYQTNNDCASVMINIASQNYAPYMVVMNYKKAFPNLNVLTTMMANALNSKMANAEVTFERWVPDDGEKICWCADCIGTFNSCNRASTDVVKKTFGYEQVKKKSAKRKTDDFREYICYKDKELVVRMIREAVKNLKGSKDIARVIRFLQDNKIITRPSFLAFISEFKELEGKISESRFNYYTYPVNRPYDNDPQYDGLVNTFELLLAA